MPNSSDCPYKQGGLCQISSELAGLPVLVADDACAACQLQANPRAINRVTCSKAIHARQAAGLIPTRELLDCISPPKQGVGTELSKLIERTQSVLAYIGLAWLIPNSDTCGCNTTRSRLNAEEPETCLANVSQHVDDICSRWQQHVHFVRFIPLMRFIVAAYIRKAAENFRRQESVQ